MFCASRRTNCCVLVVIGPPGCAMPPLTWLYLYWTPVSLPLPSTLLSSLPSPSHMFFNPLLIHHFPCTILSTSLSSSLMSSYFPSFSSSFISHPTHFSLLSSLIYFPLSPFNLSYPPAIPGSSSLATLHSLIPICASFPLVIHLFLPTSIACLHSSPLTYLSSARLSLPPLLPLSPSSYASFPSCISPFPSLPPVTSTHMSGVCGAVRASMFIVTDWIPLLVMTDRHRLLQHLT